jgi:hypothetical protein
MTTTTDSDRSARILVIRTYGCGCGFYTEDERDAISHARTTGHSLTIHGRVFAEA